MNVELVPSELGSGASRSRPSLVEASDNVLGGWWEPSLGRLKIGESARTPDVVAMALPSTSDSVRQARAFAVEAMKECGLHEVVDNARLIISEIVGNACRHAVPEGWAPEDTRLLVQLRHLRQRGETVCMVADASTRAPVRVRAHHFAESGRGLGLVSAFSSEWGWNPACGHGKIVWAICAGEP